MPSVIVYGGAGALGAAIVSRFKENGFEVVSIDVKENEDAKTSIPVDPKAGWVEQEKAILDGLSGAGVTKVDGIFCVAGGWAGGSAAANDMIANADLMWRQSVFSSAIAARIAAKHLSDGGLLQLTGAQAALAGTPGMIGYGMAKAAVQQLTKSLASPDSGLPPSSTVLALLPVTLDTPMNRKWMPKADHSTWTPLSYIASRLLEWTILNEGRPASGSLVVLTTKDGETSTEIH